MTEHPRIRAIVDRTRNELLTLQELLGAELTAQHRQLIARTLEALADLFDDDDLRGNMKPGLDKQARERG